MPKGEIIVKESEGKMSMGLVFEKGEHTIGEGIVMDYLMYVLEEAIDALNEKMGNSTVKYTGKTGAKKYNEFKRTSKNNP